MEKVCGYFDDNRVFHKSEESAIKANQAYKLRQHLQNVNNNLCVLFATLTNTQPYSYHIAQLVNKLMKQDSEHRERLEFLLNELHIKNVQMQSLSKS